MTNLETSDVIDIVALSFSIVSIIISTISSYRTNKLTKKITQKTLDTKFFEEVYFKYIITQLPSALSKIQHDEGNLSENCEVASSIVYSILEGSQFYKYFDEPFYSKISPTLIELDEKLVCMPDSSRDIYILNKNKKELTSLTNKLYSSLREYYSEI